MENRRRIKLCEQPDHLNNRLLGSHQHQVVELAHIRRHLEIRERLLAVSASLGKEGQRVERGLVDNRPATRFLDLQARA